MGLVRLGGSCPKRFMASLRLKLALGLIQIKLVHGSRPSDENVGLGSFSRESVLYLGLSDLRSGGRSNGVCSSVLSMLLGSIVIVPRFLCFPSLLSLNPT